MCPLELGRQQYLHGDYSIHLRNAPTVITSIAIPKMCAALLGTTRGRTAE